ncbi:MAG: transcriptional regulator [Candidatus Odinarchaeota archaeon]
MIPPIEALDKSLIGLTSILQENKAVFEPHRFIIILVLYLNGKMEFTKLQQLLDLTPGNLDHHIKALINAGYVTKEKAFSRRILTIIEITSKGMETVTSYARELKDLLDRVNCSVTLSMVMTG